MARQFINRDILESVIDVGSGFFLSILIQLTIFPLFNMHPTIFENFQIALIFTAVSMTRSALWMSMTTAKPDEPQSRFSGAGSSAALCMVWVEYRNAVVLYQTR